MAAPSAYEQQVLELINQLRLDPTGEYSRLIVSQNPLVTTDPSYANAISFFGVDLSAFQAQMTAYTPQAPLAWNNALSNAAEAHSQAMIDANRQSHQLPGELPLGQRINNAGYAFTAVGENVFATDRSPIYGHAAFVIDWGYDASDFVNGQLRADWRTNGDGIQDAAGHRNNMLSSTYTEIGVGVIEENNAATNNVGPYAHTQNLATRSGYQAQFVGVVINDLDGDSRYDIGEGLGGVTVTATGGPAFYSVTTWTSGGYQFEALPGTYTLTFSGGGLASPIAISATIGTSNVKVDAISNGAVASGATENRDVLTGDAGNNTIDLLGGNDEYDGMGGNDIIRGGSGNDVLRGNSGNDNLFGGTGSDTLDGGTGLDYARFDDATAPVIVYLANNHANSGEAAGDTYANIEGLILSGHNDYGFGDDNPNYLYGQGGGDSLAGGLGADYLDGGDGFDYARYDDAAYTDDIRVYLQPQFSNLNTGVAAAGDTFNSIEGLQTSVRNDTLFGNDQNNVLIGNAGTDNLYGFLGNDTLFGGAGGPAGDGVRDNFIFDQALSAANVDTIGDFERGIDQVALSTNIFGTNETRIQFNPNTTELVYTGASGTEYNVIAILTGETAFDAGDFYFY